MNHHTFTSLLSLDNRLEATIELGKLLMASGRELWCQLRENWDKEVQWSYPKDSHLACENYELGTPKDRIIAMLLLNSIESHEDWRDQLSVYCVAYHSCIFAGIDPDRLFEEVAEIIGDETSSWLIDFKNREPQDKSLDGFLFVAQKESDCMHIYPDPARQLPDDWLSMIQAAYPSQFL